MQIDWWTLGLQTLNAVVLLWILSHFFFKPVSAMIKKRQEEAGRILAEAEDARKKAEASEAKAEAEAQRLAAERGGVLDKAVAEAKSTRESILAEAMVEADKIKADARTSIKATRKKEDAETALHASRLAAELAGKLLSRLPESTLVSAFIPGLAEGIAKLPEETRKGIGTGGKPLTLVVARDMTPAENDECAAMLEKALGRKVSFTTKTDPALIAGLELEAEHAMVRNSFSADLDRILGEMIRHE